MRENRQSGSEGGAAQTNALSLPLSPRRVVAIASAADLQEPVRAARDFIEYVLLL
jgi:hypothetical protein